MFGERLGGKKWGQLNSKKGSGCHTAIAASEGLDLSWKLGLLMPPLLNKAASTSGTSLQETDEMLI